MASIVTDGGCAGDNKKYCSNGGGSSSSNSSNSSSSSSSSSTFYGAAVVVLRIKSVPMLQFRISSLLEPVDLDTGWTDGAQMPSIKRPLAILSPLAEGKWISLAGDRRCSCLYSRSIYGRLLS